jgi:hypothetical protein
VGKGQLFSRGIVGLPILRFTFENLPEGTVLTNEILSGPTVIESSTGGGIAEGDLFIPQSDSQLAGLSGSASVDLEGSGSAFVSLSGKVRTTIMTEVVPQSPPFFQRIAVGPTTSVDLMEFIDVKGSFAYRLTMNLFPEEENFSVFDQVGRYECVRTGDAICSTFYDFAQADAFFPISPQRPVVFDTFISYTASLESLAVQVPEPPPLPLMITALALIGGLGVRRASERKPRFSAPLR